MREGEIAVIFYEKLDRITEVLERRSAAPVTTSTSVREHDW
jgi:hypothetical protein